ncbi:hypothetical protein D9M69_617350 [compost metagenome]
MRQSSDADQKSDDRCGDDTGGGDDKRVNDTNLQRPEVRGVDRVANQRLSNVETGAAAQEPETSRHVGAGEVLDHIVPSIPDGRNDDDGRQYLIDTTSQLRIVEK